MTVKLCFYQRLSLVTMTVFVLMTGSFVWWSNQIQAITTDQAEQHLHLDLASQLVTDNPLLKDGVLDYDSLSNLFHTLMVLGPNFEFYYLDPEGKILTYNAEPGKVKLAKVPLTPLQQLMAEPEQLPVFGSDPKNPEKERIFSVAPVFKGEQLQGYLYVILRGERYDSVFSKLSNDLQFAQYTLMGITAFGLFLLLMVMLFAYLTHPMKKLTAAMEKVRDADFDLGQTSYERMEWNRDSIDEVQKLGCAFNDMVDHIQDQFETLQNIDVRRRNLLADLSHDLRTPLASLQGYIETLAINDEKLSSEDRQRFVQISLKNAKNLKKLIDQIFELAYLEAGQVELTKEPFHLVELLYDIVAKFALRAGEKGIQLNVVADKNHSFVEADIGKLERVLTNLIENAIRHTPANGQITLKLEAFDGEMKVSIADSGIGIKESELTRIFDTRYQASNHQKDKSIHAGLGLAICKKLMELMDTELQVTSQLDKGTTFFFLLPVKTN